MSARWLVVLCAAFVGTALADEAVESIRGPVPFLEANPADSYRTEKHDRLVPRSHRWQPPIIPHHIKGYQITKNVNTCMTCHSRAAAARTGATPVAKSHYLDRDDRRMPNISARRYFCLQCHVPQHDALPLVGNSFVGPK